MKRIGFCLLSCLLAALAGQAREVELHTGSHVFTADNPSYEASVQLQCPEPRPVRIELSGAPEGSPSSWIDVQLNGAAAGTIEVNDAAPTHWIEVQLPPGASRIELRQRPGATIVRSSYIGVVLIDDTGCGFGAPCEELAGVEINCAGVEPFVCELLGVESELYCRQLVLDRIALRYQKYPNPSVEIWTPEDRAVYHRLAPRIELLSAQQQDLYARLETLSRKRPRQLKRYLDIHRKLELHYQRALAASR